MKTFISTILIMLLLVLIFFFTSSNYCPVYKGKHIYKPTSNITYECKCGRKL